MHGLTFDPGQRRVLLLVEDIFAWFEDIASQGKDLAPRIYSPMSFFQCVSDCLSKVMKWDLLARIKIN